MRFEDLDLRELLSFEDGLIQFAGERSVIVSTAAMGMFRKELVDLLGRHAAMGVFLRLGFTQGWKMAERLKHDLPWDDEDQWRRAGGKLHALQGHVIVEVPRWNSEKKQPFAWSVWRDSFEAEQHVHLLGVCREPVCWSLTGVVSGYLSFANGRKVIARELRCRGMGDSVCYMEAQFDEDWGPEADDLRALLDEPRLEKGLERMTEVLHKVERSIELKQLSSEMAYLGNGQIIARDAAMIQVLDLAKRVAKVDSYALLTGESGSGKERIAHLIHQESDRLRGPFLAVNCGAVTESLLESELFGHARGAFTGATQDRAGFFEAARGGTLFLDEVGELPPSMQVKLLRVVQERVVRRVGENRDREVDVRLVAATHRDLAAEVADGRFREDLFYRLKVIQIHIPPLRQRKDDILPLARFFLESISARLKRKDLTGFSPQSADLLLRHPWPGNVRELENAVEHAVVLSEGPRILPEDLPRELRTGGSITQLKAGKSLAEVEQDYILTVLTSHGGNQTRTAKTLGIGTATLYRKLQKFKAQQDR